MKVMVLIFLTIIPCLIIAQSDAIDDFYASHGLRDNTVKIKVGGALIKIGSWFIEEPATRSLVRKSKRARILYSEDDCSIPRQDVDNLIWDIKSDGYESLAMVRDGMEKVEIYVREYKDFIRNLLVIVHTEDEFVMASLDCRFTYDDIQTFLNEDL
jgi:hypothetical protein